MIETAIETTTTDLSTIHPIVRDMIEESGARWSEIKDRGKPANQIVICIDPPYGFRLSNGYYEGADGWVVESGVLSAGELANFFSSFGSLWPAWIGSTLLGQYPVRAFIKDGTDDWNFSVDTKRPVK
jgi:hypothetical protein